MNAPASRTYENARLWVEAGHQVTVITCVPNHPRGQAYPGYRNKLWQWDEKDGIRILRVGTYLSANEGFLRRIANYVSYMISATLFAPLVGKADVVISTSPQFFCGLAGAFVSQLKRVPWVLEIRDLWPESIIAVGALTNRKIIGLLEGVETWMYRNADHVISVTDAFTRHIAARGVSRDRISVIKNGADLERFIPGRKENDFRREHGLTGKFVASYVGTHGMAHGLGTIFEAAELLKDRDDIVFLLVGDGAERDQLVRMRDEWGLSNVLMLPQQPKEMMPSILAATDASLVLLRKTDLFKTVIPSKIFEAMAMERAIVLGVEGESRQIIEEGECGICIEPENSNELADALVRLRENPALAESLGKNGRTFVQESFNREILAMRYLKLLENVCAGRAEPVVRRAEG